MSAIGALCCLLAMATPAASPAASATSAVAPAVAGRALPAAAPGVAPIVEPPSVAVGSGPTAIALDPATHTLYTTNQNDNTVSVVNIASCNDQHSSGCDAPFHSVQLGKGANPQAIALDAATDTLYVANVGAGTISVIDAATCNAEDVTGCAKTPASLKDPDGPNGVAVDPLTDTVYVANCGVECGGPRPSDTVSVIDGATCDAEVSSGCGQTPASVTVGKIPDALAVDPTTDTVYVAVVLSSAFPSPAGGVSVIDGASCDATVRSGCDQRPPMITVGGGPNWIGLDPANHSAYTANNTNNGSSYSTVSVIDTATCDALDHAGCAQRAATVPVGTQPWALAVDPEVHAVYVANDDDDTLSVIDTSTCEAAHTSGCGRVQPTMQAGAGPQALAVDPTSGTLYVANTIGDDVSVIDPSGCDGSVKRICRVEAPVAQVGGSPTGLAVDLADDTVYVADQGSGTVSVIDAALCNIADRRGCGRPVATVRVGVGPSQVAIDDLTGTVYVANVVSGTVSVIDGSTCNAEDTSGCAQVPPAVHVGVYPYGVAVDEATDTVYVTNTGKSKQTASLSVIDGATCNGYDHAGCGRAATQVPIGQGSYQLAVNQVTNTVYVTDAGVFGPGPLADTVAVIDGTTCNASQHSGCTKPLAEITVGTAPYGVAVDEASNTIYVANEDGADGPSSISVITGALCDAGETSGCAKTPQLLTGTGRGSSGIEFDPSTDSLAVTNSQDATVSVVPLGNSTHAGVPARFAVGSFSLSVAVDPAYRTIYVANAINGTLSLLPE